MLVRIHCSALVLSLSYVLVKGQMPFFHQTLLSRPVPNELAYCSETCLRYLARRQYFPGFLQHSTVNNNPIYYNPGDNAYRRTTNFGQQNNEKEAVSQAFMQKLLEIRNHQEITQNLDVPLKNRANEKTEFHPTQQVTYDPNSRNNYPFSLNPEGEVPFFNENADEHVQFTNQYLKNTLRAQFIERNQETSKQDQGNEAPHFNVNKEQTNFFKRVSQPNGDPANHIEITEILQQPIPNLQNDILYSQTHFQNLSEGNDELNNQNQTAEQVNVQPPSWSKHEITATLDAPDISKEDVEKAVECAHLSCTLGNWTGPVCACNHVTGKVASFRNECDLLKHNCRFDTDFKTIQEDVCPWEYPSRRSFSSDHVLFDYNKDIYYNNDAI